MVLPRPLAPINTTLAASSRKASEKDRKSTRLNSSHSQISYAVFFLKKKRDHLSECGPDRQTCLRCCVHAPLRIRCIQNASGLVRQPSDSFCQERNRHCVKRPATWL